MRRTYTAYNELDRIDSVYLPEEKHDYGPSKLAAMYLFFAQHLGMKHLNKDLMRIVIIEPLQMEVFNTEHPLPAGSVQGSAEAAKALATLQPH